MKQSPKTRAEPAAPQQQQQKQEKPAKSENGRSGEGSASALDRLRQQEKARAEGSFDKSC